MTVIYVVAFVVASVRAFQSPAATGLEAQVLPLHQALHGIPMLASSGRVAEVAGPVLAGFAWAAFGTTTTYEVIAVLFLASALSSFVTGTTLLADVAPTKSSSPTRSRPDLRRLVLPRRRKRITNRVRSDHSQDFPQGSDVWRDRSRRSCAAPFLGQQGAEKCCG